MDLDSSDELVALILQFIGKTCWQVIAAGGATGSHFRMDFGEMLRWPHDPANPRLNSALANRVHGEFGLYVECAAWRLDGEFGPVTAWTDLATPDGPMITGLQALKDRVVTTASVARPGFDLMLEFEGKYCLRVFCDQLEEPYDNYAASFRNMYFTVAPRSRVRVQRG